MHFSCRIAGAVLLGLASCAGAASRWVVTIHPLAAILREVVGPADVVVLVPPGASPHTYEPRPSDLRALDGATALVVVAPTLDGWAASLPSERRLVGLDWVPPAARRSMAAHGDDNGDVGDVDPHFWTDPRTVTAALPALIDALCAVDAAQCPQYRTRGARFARRLTALDRKVETLLAPVRGRTVLLFHPSFQYLLDRYGIRVGGLIEPLPGKEPSPRHLAALVRMVRADPGVAIFSEPQLPAEPARVVAEAAGRPVGVLDPNGGVPGRETYADLVLFNARALRAALQ